MYVYMGRHSQHFQKNLRFSSGGFWHNSQSHDTSKESSFYQCFVQIWALGDLKDCGLKPHPQTELGSTPRISAQECKLLG